MNTAPLTPEEAFCQAAAQTLAPSQLDLVLAAAHALAPPQASPHGWASLSSGLRMLSSCAAAEIDPVTALDAALCDPAVRHRTRAFLASLRDADPVDALQDAELAHRLMLARLARIEADLEARLRR